MNIEDIEDGLLVLADRLTRDHQIIQCQQGIVSLTVALNVATHLMSFCLWPTYLYVNQKLTQRELDSFLDKSANYILAEVMGVQIKGFVLTTPTYRAMSRCIKPFMKNTSNKMRTLFEIQDEEEIGKASKQCGAWWAKEYMEVTDCLGIPRLTSDEEAYTVNRWPHDFAELKQSERRNNIL